MKDWIEISLMGCLSFFLALAVYLCRGFVVYLMWPLVMTPMFGLPEIGFWQSVALVLLVGNLCTPAVNFNKKNDNKSFNIQESFRNLKRDKGDRL